MSKYKDFLKGVTEKDTTNKDVQDNFVFNVEEPLVPEEQEMYEFEKSPVVIAIEKEKQTRNSNSLITGMGYEPTEEELLAELKKTSSIEIIDCGDSFVGDEIGASYKVWEPGTTILISAQTGRGKNYFMEEVLLPYIQKMNYGDLSNKKMLVLSNRIALSSQVAQRIRDRDFVEVLSYHKFLERESNWDKYTYVICDECHFFTSDSRFNPNTGIILEKIVRSFPKAVRIYMTSTFSNCIRYILDYEKKFGARDVENYAQVIPCFVYYKLNRDYSYLDIDYYSELFELYVTIERSVNRGEKWLIFIDDKKQCEKVKSDLCDSTGIEKEKILIINSESKDEDEHKKLVKNEKFEQMILITTSVIDNGVNIKDDKLKNIVISDINKDKCLQMIGRKRVEPGQRVNLYMKKFDAEDLEKQLESINRQEDAYYYFDMAYPRDSDPTYSGTGGTIKDLKVFYNKYYNGKTFDFENAIHWFYRDRKKPERVHINEIARSFSFEVLRPRYEYILQRILEQGDGQEFLEHQLSWLNRGYDIENDITAYGREQAIAEFNEYINNLRSGRVIPKEKHDTFGIEFFNEYTKAYGFRKKEDGFKGDDNTSRTRSYKLDTIKEIFKVRDIDLIISSNRNGEWIIKNKTV